MFSVLKKIRTILFKIEHRVPYIPDFGDAWNILKILLVSFLISVIYSFSQVNRASEFYMFFWENIQVFSPYVITHLILLIFNSRIINKLSPLYAILYLILLNFITVYLVYSLSNLSFISMFDNWDKAIAKFALSYGILFFFLIYFDWREKNLHPSQLQAQLSFLQSKMRPHFLFNTLNSIISLIKREPEVAKKMLLNLSELLRASLREENTFMHTLGQEIILCKKYLEIEKMRLGDRLDVQWDIKTSLESSLVPKLSLQPLIENSVLHGIQNLEDGGLIEIYIRENLLSRIVIEIKNTQSLEKNGLKEEGNKISMKNLIERLNICFDGDIVFKTQNNGDNFYVYLEIPIRLNQD